MILSIPYTVHLMLLPGLALISEIMYLLISVRLSLHQILIRLLLLSNWKELYFHAQMTVPAILLYSLLTHRKFISGWNSWLKLSGTTVKYQYVRFTHNATLACQLTQIKIDGIKDLIKVCDVVVTTQNKVLTVAVTTLIQKHQLLALSCHHLISIGSDVIKITGTGFGSAVTVTIDGGCVLVNKTSTQIFYKTGVRSALPSAENSFIVNSDGNIAKIVTEPFLYVDRWPNTNTWGWISSTQSWRYSICTQRNDFTR